MTKKWFQKLLRKKSKDGVDPSKTLPPGTGRFVISAIKEAIFSDKGVECEDRRLSDLAKIKEVATPSVVITETNKIVHVNFNKSYLLGGYYRLRDPITKRFRIAKKRGKQSRTTGFYRRDGTVYDGAGEAPQWALDAVTGFE